MRLGNSQTTIIVACVGAAVVTGLIVFFALPAYRESLQVLQKLTEAESQVLAQYNSRQKLSETTERIKAARRIINGLKAEFLPNGAELELITAVEKIGDSHGVVTNFRINPGGSAPGLTEYNKSYTLSLTGPYRKVLDTLVDFERLPFLTTYDSLTLNSGGTGAAPDVTLELRGFVAGPPKNL